MARVPVHVIVTYGRDGAPSSSHVMIGDRAHDAATQFRRNRAVPNLRKVTLWEGTLPSDSAADLATLHRAVAAAFGIGRPNLRAAFAVNLVRTRLYEFPRPDYDAPFDYDELRHSLAVPDSYDDPWSAYQR
ncbi:hypothetical protein [Actinomadura yumaensis]|uniref:Uncharacterized protein n=1 Tax=Actinomadura yumaensis TaxID=111807 RepID=A0ABW2CNS4_9ACTN